MLTKEEREKIAERFKNHDEKYIVDFYRCLFGTNPPNGLPLEKSRRNTISRLVDLCDTSNMIELPLDKGGEVIHVGDTLYTLFGDKVVVKGIIYEKGKDIYIRVHMVSRDTFTMYLPSDLKRRHKNKFEQLADKIDAFIDECNSSRLKDQLGDIAEELYELGDSDD